MENLFNYVEKYGHIPFEEKKFNDVDNLVFSLLAYLDFTNTSVKNNNATIEILGKEYLQTHAYKEIRKLGIAQRDAYQLLERVIDKNRYKNIVIEDYVYHVGKEIQFSALTYHVTKHLKYICFEGTDELLSGWKEDGQLACFFPIPSQKEAIEYVNRNIKWYDFNVIVGGHSKGGNLALVSSMFMKWYKKFRVKKVYSNDGPGLRKKEFESKEYKNIKRKYVHIVPHCSIVGVLLHNDMYQVVKSNQNNLFGHAIKTWMIKDDELVPSKLSRKSQNLEKSILSWLDMHDDEERIKIVNAIFKVFEDADIKDFVSMSKVQNLIKIIHNMRHIDKQTKNLIKEFWDYNYKNLKELNLEQMEGNQK